MQVDKAKILYIDDEPDILELAQIYFASSGISLTTVPNAQAALDLFSKRHFDVVISDVRMPGISGQELFARLKNNMNYDGYFVLVSGHWGQHKKEEIPQGVSFVMSKPLDFDELIRKIKPLIEISSPFDV